MSGLSYLEMMEMVDEDIANGSKGAFAIAVFDLNGLKILNGHSGTQNGRCVYRDS